MLAGSPKSRKLGDLLDPPRTVRENGETEKAEELFKLASTKYRIKGIELEPLPDKGPVTHGLFSNTNLVEDIQERIKSSSSVDRGMLASRKPPIKW